MSENLETQKICPACGQANKPDDSYCRNCGGSLEGIEPVKKEVMRVPDTSETNKVQITETLAGYKYCLNCCTFILFILILVIMIYSFFVTPWSVIIFLLLLLTAFPITLCLLIQVFRFTRVMGPIRTFSISDQEIKIKIPEKPVFQIKWSEFNTVQLYKYDSGYYAAFPVGIRLQTFKINFLLNDALIKETSIQLGREFKSRTAKKIRNLIKQYANRLNKEYIWGKNIQRIRKKREKK
ncbi:MAG: hypothetical protein ACFFDK_17560 [Promethearchaeota archaeon]